MRIAPPENHVARHARLRESMRERSLDALIVTSLPNIAYLTGLFASSAVVVVDPECVRLIVDGRYLTVAQAREEVPGLRVVPMPMGGTFEAPLVEILSSARGRVGFESEHMTVMGHRKLSTNLTRVGVHGLEATDGLVERLRTVKDSWELDRLRDAAVRLSDAAKCIIPKALAGMSEFGVAAVIEEQLRRVGFAKPAFDTIVAAGPNAANPHHKAGDRRLEAGDLVVLDFGGWLDGYAVDLTRTVALGAANARQRRLLETVAEAQDAAFDAIEVGRLATELDDAARRVLTREGLGGAFSHGTGHGLGLEVHERPRVSRARPDLPGEPLDRGMVFTLEPGAYLAGWGGARIEDDVTVTAAGGERLTDVPRFLNDT